MKDLSVEKKNHYIKRKMYECLHFWHHVSKKVVDLETQQNKKSHQIDYS
jgi:hypothetical protein